MKSEDSNIRQMSVSEAWELPWVCWNLSKENYSHALGAGLLVILVNFFSQIPLIGSAVSGFITVFLTAGILNLCRHWENKSPVIFSKLFIAFNDSKIFTLLLPLAFFNSIVSLTLQYIGEGASSLAQFGLLLLISSIHSAFMTFSTALMFFKKSNNLQQAILTSAKIYLKNILPLFFAGFLALIIAGFSALLLVFPFIFFFIPLVIPYNYFLYRATYENLILNSEKT